MKLKSDAYFKDAPSEEEQNNQEEAAPQSAEDEKQEEGPADQAIENEVENDQGLENEANEEREKVADHGEEEHAPLTFKDEEDLALTKLINDARLELARAKWQVASQQGNLSAWYSTPKFHIWNQAPADPVHPAGPAIPSQFPFSWWAANLAPAEAAQVADISPDLLSLMLDQLVAPKPPVKLTPERISTYRPGQWARPCICWMSAFRNEPLICDAQVEDSCKPTSEDYFGPILTRCMEDINKELIRENIRHLMYFHKDDPRCLCKKRMPYVENFSTTIEKPLPPLNVYLEPGEPPVQVSLPSIRYEERDPLTDFEPTREPIPNYFDKVKEFTGPWAEQILADVEKVSKKRPNPISELWDGPAPFKNYPQEPDMLDEEEVPAGGEVVEEVEVQVPAKVPAQVPAQVQPLWENGQRIQYQEYYEEYVQQLREQAEEVEAAGEEVEAAGEVEPAAAEVEAAAGEVEAAAAEVEEVAEVEAAAAEVEIEEEERWPIIPFGDDSEFEEGYEEDEEDQYYGEEEEEWSDEWGEGEEDDWEEDDGWEDWEPPNRQHG